MNWAEEDNLKKRIAILEQLMREMHHPHWWLTVGSWQGKHKTFYYKKCACGERRAISTAEFEALTKSLGG